MSFFSRLVTTLRLIRYSLFPVTTFDVSPLPHPPDSLIVSPRALYACFGDPEWSAREFSILVPGVFPLGAVFILFRLKRWGFSGCRVSVGRDGLSIRGRR